MPTLRDCAYNPEMPRIPQITLILATFTLSWLAMMIFHEAGHVLHAWLSGGSVARVVLNPLSFSRTDLASNPHPLFVAWGGATWGVVIPLTLYLAVGWRKMGSAFVFRFLAGFCLIANGAYLGVGSFLLVADAGDLMHNGAPQWTLLLYGLVTTPGGLALWHRQGPNFGLGHTRGRVNPCIAVTVALTAALLVAFETVYSLMTTRS